MKQKILYILLLVLLFGLAAPAQSDTVFNVNSTDDVVDSVFSQNNAEAMSIPLLVQSQATFSGH